MTEKAFIANIFLSDIAHRGGIVRRSIDTVKRLASEDELIRAVKRRGFHMVMIGDQYVIFCNTDALSMVC